MIQNLLQHIIYNMWTHFYHFSTTVVWSRGKSPTSPSSPERSVAREQNAARQCRDWHRVTFGASNCAMDTMNVVIHMWFTNEFSLEVWLFQWWFETFEHKFPKYAEQMLGYGVCWCSNCAQFAYIKLARNPMEAFWKSISSIHQDRRLVICNTSTRSEGPEYEGPNNTHMRPQVARRRLGVFVCLCLRFLWDDHGFGDAAAMWSGQQPPNTFGGCWGAQDLGEPGRTSSAWRGRPLGTWGFDAFCRQCWLHFFVGASTFVGVKHVVTWRYQTGLESWKLNLIVQIQITGLAQAGQCSVSGCGAIAVLIRARFLRWKMQENNQQHHDP